MQLANLIRLITLAAIWGGAFLLMRIGAPFFGPVMLIEYRVALAALFLLGVAMLRKKRLNAREHWRHYLIIGLFNAALPFLLFAYAAQTLSASLLSILNATAPIWGAAIAAATTGRAVSPKIALGLALGVLGVAVLVGFDNVTVQSGAMTAVAAGVAAAFSYGIATTYTKMAKPVDAFSNAHGSMWAAALLIAPVLPYSAAHPVPGAGLVLLIFALGIVCGGIAFLLYFRLVAELGPASALTVTFLIPVFGIFWGNIFLNEPIGFHTIAGSLIVIAGTMFVTGFHPFGKSPGSAAAKG